MPDELATSAALRLELRGVSKAFGATHALVGVSLGLRPSEVHVIAGENGAGKSTLIRVLSGVYQDYSGEVLLDGRVVRLASPKAARAAGIVTIHQELSLVPALSIVDNVLINEPGASFAFARRRRARQRAQEWLELVGLELDVERAVESLSLSERQLLEIARCISEQARVFIMDEPTSALSEPECHRLFALVERIVTAGASVIYISHRMDEIYRVGQRVSVLRDGALIFTRALAAVSESELIRAMVGRDVESVRAGPRDPAPGATARLAVSAFARSARPAFEPLSFELLPGEIVGLAGLRDSGASEVLSALCGAKPGASGAVRIDGQPYTPKDPKFALVREMAFVPCDRGDSLFSELTATENASLSSLGRFSRLGWVDRSAERHAVARGVEQLRIKMPALDAPALALSGGNQQKLALLRALLSTPKILLLDDPTRGVDVAAKRDIHELVRSRARAGTSVLLHSTELDELVALCARVMVLFRGRLWRTLSALELSRDRLLSAMMGRTS
jgi:ribose transport system ATP-binding protein